MNAPMRGITLQGCVELSTDMAKHGKICVKCQRELVSQVWLIWLLHTLANSISACTYKVQIAKGLNKSLYSKARRVSAETMIVF